MAFLKKEKIADFFLHEANPYSQKRSIKGWHIGAIFGVLVVLVMGLGSYFDSKVHREHEIIEARKTAQAAAKTPTPAAQSSPDNKDYVDLHSNHGGASGPRARQYSASQIIKRGDNTADVLPMGTLVHVRLIGHVESADSKSPVTAVVVQEAVSPSGVEVIPRGTKVIGQGQIDAARERLQVSFHTLVFPEGEQFGLSALAAMPDGSTGIAGDFSSGAFKRHASQFLGSFVGGMAEGLKDRTTGGQMGIPFEPGSLKNGALNGVAQSSLDYAKSSSEEMGRAQASIKISDGEDFFIYLEREFHQ
jgi:type IV secretory pathway VirB10-like protein